MTRGMINHEKFMERKRWIQASRMVVYRIFYDSYIGYTNRTIVLEASRISNRDRLKYKKVALIEHLKSKK